MRALLNRFAALQRLEQLISVQVASVSPPNACGNRAIQRLYMLLPFIAAIALAHLILTRLALVLAVLLGALLLRQRAHHRSRAQTIAFAAEFAPLLLATASLLRAGLSPHDALRRTAEGLPRRSTLRNEVNYLLRQCESGTSVEHAISQFARSVPLPELDMFRSAFLLATIHGGPFSATLARLARVISDRLLLIRSATSATAQMRLTGNLLLGLTPLFAALAFLQRGDTLAFLRAHPVAHSVASMGALLIFGSYLLLLHMSDFEP